MVRPADANAGGREHDETECHRAGDDEQSGAAAPQHHREAPWFLRLAGGALSGQQVLEVGCGRGVGAKVILDRPRAAKVSSFDLDESTVMLARKTTTRTSCFALRGRSVRERRAH